MQRSSKPHFELERLPEGQIGIAANAFGRCPAGYAIEEYLFSGTANAFGTRAAGEFCDTVALSASPFKTRIVVARPTDPVAFNGTVVVEWLNVSSGTDAAPDWNYLKRELVRSGYAYVAVSAQKAGIDGGSLFGDGLPPLKVLDPQRYKALDHPGDAFSYDIFSQAGEAVKGCWREMLAGLRPSQVLAIGESQSAAFLVTYVNAVDPLVGVFDGFLIHSRFGGASSVGGEFRASLAAEDALVPIEPINLRSNLRVPTLVFIAETDLLFTACDGAPTVGYFLARQEESDSLRIWEVAGAAHADTYTLFGNLDEPGAPASVLATIFTPNDSIFGDRLEPPINAAPQHHYVLEAALAGLRNWVQVGNAPALQPRIEVDLGEAGPTVKRDRLGLASGGVRTPWVDVPTARHSGFGRREIGTLRLFGSTMPFSDAELMELYGGGRAVYLHLFERALDRSIKAGVILRRDRREILALAEEMYR